MEVGALAVKLDVDVIAADLFGFVVQRLGDVAEEVDEEFEGFFGVFGGETTVLYALGLSRLSGRKRA